MAASEMMRACPNEQTIPKICAVRFLPRSFLRPDKRRSKYTIFVPVEDFVPGTSCHELRWDDLDPAFVLP
jgi:hypothetical protein